MQIEIDWLNRRIGWDIQWDVSSSIPLRSINNNHMQAQLLTSTIDIKFELKYRILDCSEAIIKTAIK